MEDFQTKLEKVIDETFKILRTNNSGTRIVFPTYRDSSHRVSEQELRFVFVEQVQGLLKEYDYYYSVETPTKDIYRFSQDKKYISPRIDESGKSASFDLSIVDKSNNTIAIIEFKAKNSDSHEYAKDLCKLWNPNEKSLYKYLLNLFEKIEPKTKERFLNKLYPSSNTWLKAKTSEEKVVVIAQSLRDTDEQIRREI